MLLYQDNTAFPSNPFWITPTLATRTTADERPLTPPPSDQRRVLLVDEPHSFRGKLAAELVAAGFEVLQASDVYEAVHLARRNEIELLVIGGDQRYQSGWRCAGKLCGRPPWYGVILYLTSVSHRDRLWGQASKLSDLVETKGQAKPLVHAVLHAVGRSVPLASRQFEDGLMRGQDLERSGNPVA